MVIQSENMHSVSGQKALIMSIESLSKPAFNDSMYNERPKVKAATILNQNSSTEIIDVSNLSEKSSLSIPYVGIADVAGTLYSVDQINTSCWLKIVTIAKDCQSCNVLLMTADKGVVLKTIKSIIPGEPLYMWFTESILAMLNMPYLTDVNIKDQNRYICHKCNRNFESPNPLKIHLALECNKLDSNHLWIQLQKEFVASYTSPLSINLFPKFPSFTFELTSTPRSVPISISPILIDSNKVSPDGSVNKGLNDSGIYNSSSPTNKASPTFSSQASPPSPCYMSFYSPSSSLRQSSPVRHGLSSPHSAFTPYNNKRDSYTPTALVQRVDKPMLAPCQVYPPAPEILQAGAAEMETYFSNHAKVTNGHQCFYCKKIYSRKYGLKIHIRTHTGFRPLKCKFCSRAFGDPSNLNKHVRLHSEGETPYKCDLCKKVLVRKRDLERHMRSRHHESGHAEPISDASN